MSSPRVLFIGGSGRSGSTLLHNMLAQVDGFFGVGELRYVWRRGFIHGKRCGCGERFLACPVWARVFDDAFGGLDAVDANALASFADTFRVHHASTVFVPALRRRHLRRLDSYLRTLSTLYRSVATITGAEVIVDSSKNPAYGYLLTQSPGLHVTLAHMTRDPRAVAYSWSRTKLFEADESGQDLMERKSAARSALQWDARNLITELAVRPQAEGYVRISYEALVAAPDATLRDVLAAVGEEGRSRSFVDGDLVHIDSPNHSVFGNPIRFQRGPVTIARDDEWKEKLAPARRRVVEASTWPLRRRYGY